MIFIHIITILLLAFLIIRFIVTLFNIITNPVIPNIKTTLVEGNISICIPARNEENNITNLLNNLKKINHNRILEVLVLDDDSVDNTKNIITSFSNTYNKIRYIKGKSLPPEWLGKNWACHQLGNEAKGNFIIFLDADVFVIENLYIIFHNKKGKGSYPAAKKFYAPWASVGILTG